MKISAQLSLGFGLVIGVTLVLGGFASHTMRTSATHAEDLSGRELHGRWKQRLQDAIALGHSNFDPAVVCPDNQCAFGEWLYGRAGNTQSTPHWRWVRTRHAEFHQEAGRVLKLALDGQKSAAHAALDPKSGFALTSPRLTQEILGWKKAAS